MNKHRWQLILLTSASILSACQFVAPPTESESVPDKAAPLFSETQTMAIDWLDYADAKAEANFAIQKQDFHLLALNPQAVTLPGIDLSVYALSELEQHCGIKMLTSGEQNSQHRGLEQQQKLFAFAAQYNQLVMSACQSH